MFHVNPFPPGAQIHGSDPFATPDADRSPARRLRGRFAATVALWTTPGPAGLTVSSTVVADGDPARLLGLIDDESDFWDAASAAGRFAVALLGPGDRQLADRFAGLMPAPGGLFAEPAAWTATDYGPIPAHAGTWAGCRLDDSRAYGWNLLVEATIQKITVGAGTDLLLHHRGRYREIDDRSSS
jgi:flavin reductase (DIM6/NTAB) family NADH-FMN oxidoreductase RutF